MRLKKSARRRPLKLFADQPYKIELINDLGEDKVTIYRQGNFTDLCRGPHVKSTGEVKAFKLVSVAGAYWRGDEKRPMLQRIYGVAFARSVDLEEYLKRMAEAAKRDHRKLGKELDLFSLHEEAGPGLVYWHPEGSDGQADDRGFLEGRAPAPWLRHRVFTAYRQGPPVGDQRPLEFLPRKYVLSHGDRRYTVRHQADELPIPYIDVQDAVRSYRNLPMRYAELGTVYRYERSGVLHGLARVRGFTQDDAHIFCRPDQIESEVKDVVELAQFMMKSFGFEEYEMMLSTRPEKYTGTLESWDMATEALRNVLEKLKIDYHVDPGEGVFYGPKIDVKLKDAIGRLWQGPTIQVDFQMPERFDVNYVAEDGQEHRSVMIHRTVLGSMERFFACLTEHYAGAFPVWLAPVQAVLIPIADRHVEYASKLCAEMRSQDHPGPAGRPVGTHEHEDTGSPVEQDTVYAGDGRQGGRERDRIGAPAQRGRPGLTGFPGLYAAAGIANQIQGASQTLIYSYEM